MPDEDVDVLLVPSSAPWLKASEAVDFARAVKAPRNVAIHDRIYTEAAHGILEGHMNAFLPAAGQSYVRLADGADLLIRRSILLRFGPQRHAFATFPCSL